MDINPDMELHKLRELAKLGLELSNAVHEHPTLAGRDDYDTRRIFTAARALIEALKGD